MNEKLYSLLDEAYLLSTEIKDMNEKLKNIKEEIMKSIDVPKDKKSFKISTSNLTMKVTFKKVLKWDQVTLEKIKNKVGDNIFYKIFTTEYKPIKSGIQDILNNFNKEIRTLFNKAVKEENRAPYIEIYKESK